MKMKLGMFQDEILIPDEYSKLDKKQIKATKEKGNWYEKITENSINYVSGFVTNKKESMDFDNKESLINEIHSNMDDNQGIICVENGKTKNNRKYIYSIVKTVNDPLSGVSYYLRMNIQYDKKIYEIEGEFSEYGTTGVRDSVILQLMMSQGIVTIENDILHGWLEDPYDKSYTKGVLMNLSEKEEFDEIFPDHPLTQAREFVNFIIDNEKPKKLSLDDQLNETIKIYNDTYNQFSDSALQLYFQRVRSVDTIQLVENLINSIANHPKNFDKDFCEINKNKSDFIDAQEFASQELEKAKKEALGAGAGVAAGAAITALAPTTAMWVATTFGTASTGTAISALSGAAATNAALAWLGGGALATGGGGMVAGNALLALAGSIGWGIAGFSILTSVVLFANNKLKTSKKKQEEILSVKTNTNKLKEDIVFVEDLISKTELLRNELNESYSSNLKMYNCDFNKLNDEQKFQLGALVNNTKSLASLLNFTLAKEDK